VQAWTLATAFLAAVLVIRQMIAGVRCIRVGRLAGGGGRLLRVIRTGRSCLIVGKRNLSIHRRRRVRHRVGELTEDESAHEEENHGPMRESTMTHGPRLAFHPGARNRSPLKGAPRHSDVRDGAPTLEFTPGLVRPVKHSRGVRNTSLERRPCGGLNGVEMHIKN
jgi:hypothetical protein